MSGGGAWLPTAARPGRRSNRATRLSSLFGGLLIALAVHADDAVGDLYKCADSQGHAVFRDRAETPDCRRVDIAPADLLQNVRDGAVFVPYVPEIPSKPLKGRDWSRWTGKADQIISVVGAGSKHQAKAIDILYEATRAGLGASMMFALTEMQSRFDEYALSARGGIGLLGISPSVHAAFGNPANTLYQGKYNLRLGCVLLRHYLDESNGDLSVAMSRFYHEVTPGNSDPPAALWPLIDARIKELGPLDPTSR